MNQITVNHCTEVPFLYYEGQSQIQPVSIWLDPAEEEAWVVVAHDNSTPESIWHRRVVEFGVSLCTPEKYNELMESKEFQNLARKICDGYEEVWDGSNNVGTYTDEGKRAEEELGRLVEAIESNVEVRDADEWYEGGDPEEVDAAARELKDVDKLCDWLDEHANDNGDHDCLILNGTYRYAQQVMDRVAEDTTV